MTYDFVNSTSTLEQSCANKSAQASSMSQMYVPSRRATMCNKGCIRQPAQAPAMLPLTASYLSGLLPSRIVDTLW